MPDQRRSSRFSLSIPILQHFPVWNTLYINAALEQLQADGYLIRAQDVARLSPLVFEHINLLGRYAFSVPDVVNRGELRPLRDPGDSLEDVA